MTLLELFLKLQYHMSSGADTNLPVAISYYAGRPGEYIPVESVEVSDLYNQDTSGDPLMYVSEPNEKFVLLIKS